MVTHLVVYAQWLMPDHDADDWVLDYVGWRTFVISKPIEDVEFLDVEVAASTMYCGDLYSWQLIAA